jgi:hypothetical protein
MSFMDPGMTLDAKQLLREDDSLLRQIFFNVLKHHHPQLAAKVSCVYVRARDTASRSACCACMWCAVCGACASRVRGLFAGVRACCVGVAGVL